MDVFKTLINIPESCTHNGLLCLDNHVGASKPVVYNVYIKHFFSTTIIFLTQLSSTLVIGRTYLYQQNTASVTLKCIFSFLLFCVWSAFLL